MSFVFTLVFFVSCNFTVGLTDSEKEKKQENTSETADADAEITDTGDTVTDTGDTDTDTGDTITDIDTDTDTDTGDDTGDTITDIDIDIDIDTDTDTGDTDSRTCNSNEKIDNFDGDSIKIRIVAGNITSGNKQSYDPGHGIRIFQALKPDIALVQEMNYKNNSDSDYKNFAQQIVGTNCYAIDDADYQIPNGVVSKYPITSHGYWKDPKINNRALMWAVVDIPGDTDIFAVSVHLHTKPTTDQTTAAKVIVDEIAKVKEKNPGKYYYVVGGDFNGPTAVSSDGFGKNNTFYVGGPHPVDENGDEETNANGSNQYDFVLADYPLHEFQVPVVYYSNEDSTKTKCYENGLVFDTRVYSQSVLDEYFSPAETGDSGASQMQHMAVVKDFLIEVNK